MRSCFAYVCDLSIGRMIALNCGLDGVSVEIMLEDTNTLSSEGTNGETLKGKLFRLRERNNNWIGKRDLWEVEIC